MQGGRADPMKYQGVYPAGCQLRGDMVPASVDTHQHHQAQWRVLSLRTG